MNTLEQLRQHSTIVADSASFQDLAHYQATDATTNPSLILKAVEDPRNQAWLKKIWQQSRGQPLAQRIDRLLVAFGLEILQHTHSTPTRLSRVSTEVDARLSFDTEATVAKAQQLVALYAAEGIEQQQILIKIASTWQGICAAERLQQQGIACNLTLLFSLTQAQACAWAKVQLISPFVGRVSDWAVQRQQMTLAQMGTAEHDKGIALVRAVYQYYKKWQIPTEVMGASFRNVQQVLALAGCDLLTISPNLLAEMQDSTAPVVRQLITTKASDTDTEPSRVSAQQFYFNLNQDEMAHDKLAEGIRLFITAGQKLEALLTSLD